MIRKINHSNFVRTVLFVGLMVLGLAAAGPVPVWATDAVVGNGTAASCTEMEFNSALAVVQASGDGEVSFNCGGPATIIFGQQKVINSNLVIINGGGVITLSGGNSTRLFDVVAGAFELRNITLTNGFSGNGYGGAVLAEQGTKGTSVYVINSTIQNSRTNSGFAGGAILSFATQTTIPAVSIENSTIQGNESDYGAINTVGKLVVSGSLIQNNTGGGLSVGGPTTIANTDFFGNVTALDGGALYATATADVEMTGGEISGNLANGIGGGIANHGAVSLTDVTVSSNEGLYGGGIFNTGDMYLYRVTFIANNALAYGDKVFNDTSGYLQARNSTFYGVGDANPLGTTLENAGALVFQNSTLWGNTVASQVTISNNSGGVVALANTLIGGDVGANCGGPPLDSSDFSLFEDSSCTWGSGSGNIVHPGLTMGPLGLHGGLTKTMVPPANSPAIDAGQCNLTVDQRGVSRPQGPACDIGSVERRPVEGSHFIYLPITVN